MTVWIPVETLEEDEGADDPADGTDPPDAEVDELVVPELEVDPLDDGVAVGFVDGELVVVGVCGDEPSVDPFSPHPATRDEPTITMIAALFILYMNVLLW